MGLGGYGLGAPAGRQELVHRTALALVLLLALPACGSAQQQFPPRLKDAHGESLKRRDRKRLVAAAGTLTPFLYNIAYVPGRDLVLAGTARDLQIFSARDLKSTGLVDIMDTVASISVSGDGKLAALGLWGRGDHLRVYSLEQGKFVAQFTGYPIGRVARVAISSDGRYLAATATSNTDTSHDNATRVWNWKLGKLVLDAQLDSKKRDNQSSAIAFNPKAPLFYEAFRDTLVAYSTRTWKVHRQISYFKDLRGKTPPHPIERKLAARPESYRLGPLAVSPDGRLLAIFQKATGTVLLLDAKTLRLVRWMEPEKPSKQYYYVNRYVEAYGLAFSRDGRYIATCGYWVWVWDVATGKMVARINEGKLQSGTLRALFFDPSGELLYTGGDSGIFKWRWGRPKEGPGDKQRKGGEPK